MDGVRGYDHDQFPSEEVVVGCVHSKETVERERSIYLDAQAKYIVR